MRRRRSSIAALVLSLAFTSSCDTATRATSCAQRAVAFLGALTGQERRRPHQNGAELALHLYNAQHSDCPVGYIRFDSQGDPELAKRLARTIVDDPQIIAVVGPGYSGETAAAMPIFNAAGLPVVTASATNPTLSQQGWQTFHRVVGNDAAQGPAAAAFLSQVLTAKRVAIIDDGGLYGKALADLVAKGLGERGVVVAPRSEVDAHALDYKATVAAIAEIGVDAVFYGGVTEPGVRLLRQLRDAHVGAPFMGGDGIFDPSFIAGVGPAAVGTFATCSCLDPNLVDTSARKSFRRDYLSLFHDEPVAFAMEYFDVANLMLAAFDAGVSTRAGMDQWLDASDSNGITKKLSFDEHGEVRVGPIYVLKVERGRFTQVASVVDGRVQES